MIHRELLEVLACPKCKRRVDVDPSTESLRCENCRLEYPIREDVPIMLPDEAIPY
ncbi:MAG: Trm112 family protein [Candidatus Krumholzibacteriia bacterium]